jgi:transcriptional regulator with XRE-family HTH domain
METVKFELKKVRVNKKITQQDLSDRTGIHQQQISRYERSISIPTLEVAKKIADGLCVTLDELVVIREMSDKIGLGLKELENKAHIKNKGK